MERQASLGERRFAFGPLVLGVEHLCLAHGGVNVRIRFLLRMRNGSGRRLMLELSAHGLGGAGSLTGTLQLQRVLKIGDIDGTGAGARWPANGSKRDDESHSYSASVHLTVVWSFDHATGWRIIAPAWQVSFPIYAFYRPWGTIV
jgi:hypothetical protein